MRRSPDPGAGRRSCGWSRAPGLAEGKSFVNGILGADSDKRVQQATRTLASAFFIRHLTDAPQLADQLETKVAGTKVLDPADPDLTPPLDAGDLANAAML